MNDRNDCLEANNKCSQLRDHILLDFEYKSKQYDWRLYEFKLRNWNSQKYYLSVSHNVWKHSVLTNVFFRVKHPKRCVKQNSQYWVQWRLQLSTNNCSDVNTIQISVQYQSPRRRCIIFELNIVRNVCVLIICMHCSFYITLFFR